jgi:tRNA (adenine57-N1/adenine58-N1)-methyltransferase
MTDKEQPSGSNPAYVVYKPEKTVEVDGVRRVVQRHEQWFIEKPRDAHLAGCVIRQDELKPGRITKNGQEFIICPATFLDRYKSIRRDAQLITRKDLGFIAGYCGLTKNSTVVESGAGSGGATILFAALCKHVYTYEIDKSRIDLVSENLDRCGITNATLTLHDMYDANGVEAVEADLVLLDVPEPWEALRSAIKAARLGGYIVAYTPSIIQAQRVVHALAEHEGLLLERTTEIIDRDWRIRGDAVRPLTADIGHTAFLTIIRRIL